MRPDPTVAAECAKAAAHGVIEGLMSPASGDRFADVLESDGFPELAAILRRAAELKRHLLLERGFASAGAGKSVRAEAAR